MFESGKRLTLKHLKGNTPQRGELMMVFSTAYRVQLPYPVHRSVIDPVDLA